MPRDEAKVATCTCRSFDVKQSQLLVCNGQTLIKSLVSKAPLPLVKMTVIELVVQDGKRQVLEEVFQHLSDKGKERLRQTDAFSRALHFATDDVVEVLKATN